MTLPEVIAIVFIFIGVFFAFAGVVGTLRMPDVYSRLHTSGKISTLSMFGLLTGVAILMPQTLVKVIVLVLFLLLTAPVVSHAIASAAYHLGIRPARAVRDDLADEPMEQSPVG
jgi:multicomponent Na+:H+ antiporter subunit G